MFRLQSIGLKPLILRWCSFPRSISASYHTCYSENDPDYQYLQRSELPTMYFQESLLRLRIPELKDTCSRYLRSQRAILSDEEYKRTELLMNDFIQKDGLRLQQELIAEDKENLHTSYISKPWFKMYLKDRVPLVHNYNPFFAFQPESRPEYNHPVIRATNIIISSMRFMHSLRESVLKPEVYHLNPEKSNTALFRTMTKWAPKRMASFAAYAFKAFPLDMSQFDNLFHSTRIPMENQDRIQKYENVNHVLLMKNGNFYIFDLFDEDGDLYSSEHIHACVDLVYKDQSPMPKDPIGVLTSQNRDEWAEMRNILWNAGNAEQLRLIDSAAFNFVFDDATVELDPEKCFKTFLSGDARNRWFDKSFSLIMSADGLAAINFEHAWGDGVAVMRYFSEVAEEIKYKSWIYPNGPPPTIDASEYVRKLVFDVPEVVSVAIQMAHENYEVTRNSLAIDVHQSQALGRKLCKETKVSPDAIMQLGFQVAYHLQYGLATSTYESCSTAAFRHGRTETLRPATIETKALCDALLLPEDKRPSKSELKDMIIQCSKIHSKLTKEAAMGQGFDRHLFALRTTCENRNERLHPVYNDNTFKKLNKHVISTSTLPSPEISVGGFAPVVQDGFGIGYRIQDDELGVVATTYPPNNDGPGFIACVDKAYTIIADILKHK